MGEGLAQKLAMGTAHSPEQRKQRAGEEESAVSSPAHPPPRAAEPMSPESPALPNFKDAVREALATRRRIVGEEELAKTPNRRDKALKYVLRPYGYKLLVFECIGVLLMLAHGSTTVLWFGEEKAQRVNHKRCVANGMAFRQADDIDVATDPPFFSSPKGVGHAYGMSAREHVRRWRGHRRRERMEACGDGGVGSCDAVLSVMGGVTLELNSATAGLEPKPKLKESEYARLARQAWDNWSKKKRRRLCEPLDTRPKVGRRPACWRYCRLCDYVRTAMEVWDFIAFLLMMRTAYKVETESGGYYEYRPRQIFRYRITRPYFVLQLLIGMPTYSALKLLSGGHLTPISLIQIKAIGRWEKFQRHMRAHLMEYLRIAIKTGVVSNLRALLKLVRSVKWIIDLWNLIFRHVQLMLRMRKMLTRIGLAIERFYSRRRLDNKVFNAWAMLRRKHSDGIGIKPRLGVRKSIMPAISATRRFTSKVAAGAYAAGGYIRASISLRSTAAAGAIRRSVFGAQAPGAAGGWRSLLGASAASGGSAPGGWHSVLGAVSPPGSPSADAPGKVTMPSTIVEGDEGDDVTTHPVRPSHAARPPAPRRIMTFVEEEDEEEEVKPQKPKERELERRELQRKGSVKKLVLQAERRGTLEKLDEED